MPESLSNKIISSFDSLVTAWHLLYLTLSYISQFCNVLSNVSFIKHVSQETSLSIQLLKKALRNPYSVPDVKVLHYPAVNKSDTVAPRVALTKKIVLTIFSFKVPQYNITETSSQYQCLFKKI